MKIKLSETDVEELIEWLINAKDPELTVMTRMCADSDNSESRVIFKDLSKNTPPNAFNMFYFYLKGDM